MSIFSNYTLLNKPLELKTQMIIFIYIPKLYNVKKISGMVHFLFICSIY